MGEHAQKRLIRKLDLERFLSTVAPQPDPKRSSWNNTRVLNRLLQTCYTSLLTLMTTLLARSVLDLGCGTGRLSLGASYLGAKDVVGIDIDRLAIKTAYENSNKAGVSNVQWVHGDIGCNCWKVRYCFAESAFWRAETRRQTVHSWLKLWR